MLENLVLKYQEIAHLKNSQTLDKMMTDQKHLFLQKLKN
jgi:hypothetical protein